MYSPDGTMFRRRERPQGMDRPSAPTPPPPEPSLVSASPRHRPRSPGRGKLRGALVALVALTLTAVLVGCGGSGSDDATDDGTATSTQNEAPASEPADDGGSGNVGAADPGGTEPVGPTAELPDDFPEELTPPDDAVYRTGRANEQGGKKDWFVVASIPGEVTEVADAIVAQLESAGYTVSADEEGGIPGGAESRTIQSESDTYTASIGVDNADVVGGVEGSANVSYTVTEM